MEFSARGPGRRSNNTYLPPTTDNGRASCGSRVLERLHSRSSGWPRSAWRCSARDASRAFRSRAQSRSAEFRTRQRNRGRPSRSRAPAGRRSRRRRLRPRVLNRSARALRPRSGAHPGRPSVRRPRRPRFHRRLILCRAHRLRPESPRLRNRGGRGAAGQRRAARRSGTSRFRAEGPPTQAHPRPRRRPRPSRRAARTA